MKSIILSTYDSKWGAFIAANRLNQGFSDIGVDGEMFVRYKLSDVNNIVAFDSFQNQISVTDEHVICEAIQKKLIDDKRSDLSNTIFSFPYPGIDLSDYVVKHNFDVINLHWISNFLSPVSIKKLLATGKPVIWTLHDQNAFTGGCHYSAGCEKYTDDCYQCPQLQEDHFHIPWHVLQTKKALLKDENITVVSPSQWMADCARKSSLFKHKRIEVIPNGIDVDHYQVKHRLVAKRDLNIPSDCFVISYCSSNIDEKRKGLNLLLEALKIFLEDEIVSELSLNNRILLLCIGDQKNFAIDCDIPKTELGFTVDQEMVATALSGSDVMVLPSLEDNLPNTIIEAFLCKTPVIAFNIGGIADLISDGDDGLLIDDIHASSLANALTFAILNRDKIRKMGQRGKHKILSAYTHILQAERYKALMLDILADHPMHHDHVEDIAPGQAAIGDIAYLLDEYAGAANKESVSDQMWGSPLKNIIYQAATNALVEKIKSLSGLGESP